MVLIGTMTHVNYDNSTGITYAMRCDSTDDDFHTYVLKEGAPIPETILQARAFRVAAREWGIEKAERECLQEDVRRAMTRVHNMEERIRELIEENRTQHARLNEQELRIRELEEQQRVREVWWATAQMHLMTMHNLYVSERTGDDKVRCPDCSGNVKIDPASIKDGWPTTAICPKCKSIWVFRITVAASNTGNDVWVITARKVSGGGE